MSGRDSSFDADFRVREDFRPMSELGQRQRFTGEERPHIPPAVDPDPRYNPSRTFSFSPPKYARVVQSADNTFAEEVTSPTSLANALSPRFTEKQPFVSDYVAFGKGKDSSFHSSKERNPPVKCADAVSFSLYSDQSSYPNLDETTSKSSRLEQQLTKKNDVIAQLSRENAALSRDLQDIQQRISSFENYRTETQLQLQESQRELKASDGRYRQLVREMEELKGKQTAKEEQYRRLDRQVSSLALLQGKVEELEAGKSICAREIAELKKEVAGKIRENEELRIAVERKEREAREVIAEKTEENHCLKKERLRLLRELDETKRRENALERELKAESADRSRLKSHLQKLQDTVRTAEDRRDTEETIEVLRRENDALISELRSKSRPQDLEKRIMELEAALREEQQHVRDLKLVKEDRRRMAGSRKRGSSGCSRSRTDDSSEPRSKSPSTATQKRVLRELMEIAGVNNSVELVNTVKALMRKGKSLEAANEFIERINAIVVQFSPPGTFLSAPSLKQVWKWVSRLIDEYMTLRKSHESQALFSSLASELMALLGVPHYSEILSAVERLVRRSRCQPRDDL